MKRQIAILMVFASTALAASPTPTAEDLGPPLAVMTNEPRSFIMAQPVVRSNAGLRRDGVILATVSAEFDTRRVRKAVGGPVGLIQDEASPRAEIRFVALHVPDALLDNALEAIRRLDGVLAAGADSLHELTTNDPYWSGQRALGLDLLNLPNGWQISVGSSRVTVAVLDTGITEVPDLAGRVRPGRSFIDQDPTDTSDPVGHGTEVATVIAAMKDDGIGTAGVAPGVNVLSAKACYNYVVVAHCETYYVAPALQWLDELVLDGSVQIINMSFSGNYDDNEEYWLRTIDEHGGILVGAAGNSGISTVEFPARSSHVIAVSGTTSSGSRAPNSSYGIEIDAAAPYATYATDSAGSTGYVSGTSFSAPVISGIAALAASAWPNWFWNRNDFMLALQSRLYTNQTSWNQETGWGVPNSWAFLYQNWCARFDLAVDGRIDVRDDAVVAYRYGSAIGYPLYNVRFDLEPGLTADGDIDIKDLQKVFGRDGSYCRT